VELSADYVYDAIYRLTRTTGREHLGQTSGGQLRPPTPTSPTDAPRVGLAHPGDGKAMGRYTETYNYDEVGNIAKVVHTAPSGGWTRRYAYDEPSLIEQAKTNNRLSATTVRDQVVSYAHDAHGNMTSMPHLPVMLWDHEDQLRATSKQVVGNGGTPETTYYVYGSAGQRVRKVTERQAAPGQRPTRKEERIYLGGYEVYREYNNNGATVTLERESLHVMDDKQRIALVETRTLDTAGNDPTPSQLIRYQFGNHLGSASLELDDQAQIISYEEYTPYGSTSYQAVRSQTETPKRYRFTGMERDEESGLAYHSARYYLPWLGRWGSCDPIGVQDGLNLYQYCRGSPINRTDKSGSETKWSLNPFDHPWLGGDYDEFAPLEFSARVTLGAAKTAYHTAEDTLTRTIDLATQGTAVFVKALTSTLEFDDQGRITGVSAGIELPYTRLSPEAKRYDENLSYADNLRKTGSETKKGLKALAEGLKNTDPEAIGTAGFIVVTSVGGKPPSFPNIPFLPAPQLVTSVTSTGVRATQLVWESTAISTSTLAKFGGPIFAEAVTNQPSSVDPLGEPFTDPAPPKYKSGHPSNPVTDHRVNRARGGHPTDPANLDIKTWEANARKGGFEGNYARDFLNYMRQGLSQTEAEYVLRGEADFIVNDVHPRPVNPFALDELANQPQVCRPEPQPFWRK
jgi:RHS repeat-associated protein